MLEPIGGKLLEYKRGEYVIFEARADLIDDYIRRRILLDYEILEVKTPHSESPEKEPKLPKVPRKVLTEYEKGLIWKMYEIFRGPDEDERLRKVVELTGWDLRTVKKVVAEGPRLWVAVPPIVPAKPKERIRFAPEILPPEEAEEVTIDLEKMTLEDLESLKKAIDEELRRRGYLRS